MEVDQHGVLRIGIALVFLWFGVSQLLRPEQFLAYAPAWLGVAPSTIIFVNGVFETVCSSLLLLGVFPRVTASLLFLHMFGIVYELGYSQIAVRDFGITVALFVIVVNGVDRYSVMRFWQSSA